MEKITIFLAADSTVQSYTEEPKIQAGWGEMLHLFLREEREKKSWHPESAFAQVMCYETDGVIIDNRAMAGRSSKSFMAEGRLAEIEQAIKKGDYLFVQFAHNDANEAKPERYCTLDEYEENLLRYAKVCRVHGATCVLVTAIAMRNCDENPNGEFSISFPQYRERMIETAKKHGIALLDLGKATTQYCASIGAEGTKELFMWIPAGQYDSPGLAEGKQDNAHLKESGAKAFARILAQLIQEYDADGQLDSVKSWLEIK